MVHALYIHGNISESEAIELVNSTGVSIIYGDAISDDYTLAYPEDDEVKVKAVTLNDLDEYSHIPPRK
jgi:hypothetical protein